MKKTQLYLLALAIAAIALAAIGYKWRVLQFPLQPDAEIEVWTLQARIGFIPEQGANRVTLQVPGDTPGWSVLDERFVARGYSKLEDASPQGRRIQWAIRQADGEQALYYRAHVVRARPAARPLLLLPEEQALIPELDEPYATASRAVLDRVREESADTETFARGLVRRFLEAEGEDLALLADLYESEHEQVALMAGMLAARNIIARPVHGLQLDADQGPGELRPWLAVLGDDARWFLVDPRSDAAGWPEDFFLWSVGAGPVAAVEGNDKASFELRASHNLANAVAVAERRLEVRDAKLVQFSLLGLPLQAQQTYAILLMVPVGAFIMLLLRNVVGVKTFGTFMPVLVALAFRDTGLASGIGLFALVVGAGLLARFYLERLRLLLVPRLTAVLIVVVLLMAGTSVLFHRLDLEVGLSVALFPMVIMAMTIERMSVVWDERGGAVAVREALGTLVVSAVVYIAMSWPWLERFVFVFPETLLLLLAACLLLGRYAGYRLTELYRFRALARERAADPDPIAPEPPATPG
ncbi:inactive transglutaminase family protein [Luteimonas pelagia]